MIKQDQSSLILVSAELCNAFLHETRTVDFILFYIAVGRDFYMAGMDRRNILIQLVSNLYLKFIEHIQVQWT